MFDIINTESEVRKMTNLEIALIDRIKKADKLIEAQNKVIDILKQEVEFYKTRIERMDSINDPFN